MNDEAQTATPTYLCDTEGHFWVSSHEPHAPIWIIACQFCGRHDFEQMLAEHDREVAATALEDVMRDSLGAFMGEVLRQRAAEIRNPTTVSTPTEEQ